MGVVDGQLRACAALKRLLDRKVSLQRTVNRDTMDVRPFRAEDTAEVIELWERCNLTRPWNDPRKDIARKMRVQPELFLVGRIEDALIATIMAGYEGHRGWVKYLAVSPECQRRGYARADAAHRSASPGNRLPEAQHPGTDVERRGSRFLPSAGIRQRRSRQPWQAAHTRYVIAHGAIAHAATVDYRARNRHRSATAAIEQNTSASVSVGPARPDDAG